MEGGDVRGPCEQFGAAVSAQHVPAHEVEVDAVEQSHGSESAAQRDDCIRVRIAPRVDEISAAFGVRAGQVLHPRVTRADVVTWYDLEAPGFELGDRALQRLLVGGSRRCDQPNGVTSSQGGRFEVRTRLICTGELDLGRTTDLSRAINPYELRLTHSSPSSDFPNVEPLRAAPACIRAADRTAPCRPHRIRRSRLFSSRPRYPRCSTPARGRG